MKYMYEVQDSLTFFETQRMNLELFSFLQMDYPLGIGFCVYKLSQIVLIAFFFYQSKIMFIFVMCHATCVVLKNENMHVCNLVTKYHLDVLNVLLKYNFIHDKQPTKKHQCIIQ